MSMRVNTAVGAQKMFGWLGGSTLLWRGRGLSSVIPKCGSRLACGEKAAPRALTADPSFLAVSGNWRKERHSGQSRVWPDRRDGRQNRHQVRRTLRERRRRGGGEASEAADVEKVTLTKKKKRHRIDRVVGCVPLFGYSSFKRKWKHNYSDLMERELHKPDAPVVIILFFFPSIKWCVFLGIFQGL